MSEHQRIAVVTGAASGIGAASARRLAESGCLVVAADLDLSGARALADEVGGHALAVDVVDEASVQNLLSEVEGRWGLPHVLVTSAGVTHNPVPADDLDLAEFQRVMSVDVQGTWLPVQVFGVAMAAAGRGAIVTVSSVAGLRSVPLHAYGPAKAAVIQMTQNLAMQWGRQGVRVNGVAPGYTLTPLLETRIAKGERDSSRMKTNSAMGRLVGAHEVAAAVEFLASDAASAITGVTLPVDAGWLTAPPWATYSELTRFTADRRLHR